MKLMGTMLGPAALVFLLFTPPASAHTAIKSTQPRDGAELEESPAEVVIQFAHAARLTSVVASGEDTSERRLEFTPPGSAITFKIPEPGLGLGRNEIRWKALADDGHVIEGLLVIIIKPDAAGTK